MISLLLFLFIFNNWNRKYMLNGGGYSLSPLTYSADVFITTKSEPADLVAKTVEAAAAITYPYKKIYVFDDGNRPEIKKVAEAHGCIYMVRPSYLNPKQQFKAANLNFAFSQTESPFILVLDADQIVRASILDDLLGHFNDDKVALVTTRQRFDVPEHDFNHDHVFYEYMQTGKNYHNVAISCGSGVIYRRSALEKIGGFQEWNIVEDLYTTYALNTRGYKSLYTNQSYTLGDAPTDLKVIYKQRFIWAADTVRLFIWRFPLLNFKLTFRQRLQYFEMGYIYIVSGLVIPAIYVLNMYSLFSNKAILNVGILYLFLKIPSMYFTLRIYNDLGYSSASSRMWSALFPIFFASTLTAAFYAKPRYSVTNKKVKASRNILLALPQFVILLIGTIAVIFHLVVFGVTLLLLVNTFWFFLMIYWLWPVFPLALKEQT